MFFFLNPGRRNLYFLFFFNLGGATVFKNNIWISFRIFVIPGNGRHLAVKGEGLRRCGEAKAGEELTGWPGWGLEL